MTNRPQYEFTCKVCGKLFIAYKRTTKYCGKNCAKRGHKAEIIKEQFRTAKEEIQEQDRQKLLLQENLSLTNAAAFVPIC